MFALQCAGGGMPRGCLLWQSLAIKSQRKTLVQRNASSMKEPDSAKLYVSLHEFNKLDAYMNTKLSFEAFGTVNDL